MAEITNLVDASGWLEYLTGGPDAAFFEPAMAQPDRLVVPAVTIYEVVRSIASAQGTDQAFQAAALMQQARVIPVSGALAVQAALSGADGKLSLVASVVREVAKQNHSSIWALES